MAPSINMNGHEAVPKTFKQRHNNKVPSDYQFEGGANFVRPNK